MVTINKHKVSEFSWLRSFTSNTIHPSPTQSISEELILCLWIKWLIEDFIFPLLSVSWFVIQCTKIVLESFLYY